MRVYYVLICAAILLVGCSSNDDRKDEQESAVSHSYTSQDQILCEQAAEVLVKKFSCDLKAALQQAIEEGGAVNAIDVCQQRAPEVAAAYSGNGWSIRRVSDCNRNPGNHADSAETIILGQFTDSTSLSFVAKWRESDSKTSYCYYQPIHAQLLCLKCHGEQEDLGYGVKNALQNDYPDDLAVGYKVGDLRGMLVVEAQWPAGKEFAEKLIAGNR